jgi:hypothetical protein
MIGCNANVSCTTFDHGQNGVEDATYGTDFLAVRICHFGHSEKVPEQFVRPVN